MIISCRQEQIVDLKKIDCALYAGNYSSHSELAKIPLDTFVQLVYWLCDNRRKLGFIH